MMANFDPSGEMVCDSAASRVGLEDTNAWKGPSMQTLREEGLGKGINVTNLQDRRHAQILPTEANLEISRHRTGHYTIDEEMETTSSRRNMLSFQTQLGLGAVHSVSFKFGFNVKDGDTSTVKMKARGSKIVNEKVSFKETEEIGLKDIPFVCFLENEAKRQGFENDSDIPDEKRDKICRDVIRVRNKGVTHYVSAVDLGAMVYELTSGQETMMEKRKGGIGEGQGGFHGMNAKLSINFSKNTEEMSKYAKHEIYKVVDDDVEWKGEDTRIQTNQEKVIGYDISPVWDLVEDTAWKKSVRKACMEYVHEHTPLSVDKENPFLIKIPGRGRPQYLRVEKEQLQGTPTKKNAHPFTLHVRKRPNNAQEYESSAKKTLDDPECGFNLCYKAPGGQKLFLTRPEIQSQGPVTLSQATLSQAQGVAFFLAGTGRQAATIWQWQQRESLLIIHRRKAGLLQSTRDSYMVLERSSDKSPFILTEKTEIDPSNPSVLCQFSLDKPLLDYSTE